MKQATTAQTILQTILNSTKLFQDKSGKAFVKIPTGARTDCIEVSGQRFEDFIIDLYFKTTSNIVSQNELKGLVRLVAAQARQMPHEETFLRFGAANGVHILDLANPSGMVVDVTAAGWTYSTTPMVNFLRPPSLLEIPTPIGAGDYTRIAQYLNLTEDGKLLVLPSMPAMLMADIERPIILLVGDKRKGKSTIARLYRTLLDPADPWANKSPRKIEEQALLMGSNALPVLDNLSDIPPWLSDMYCEAFTGGGFQKRTLYTNAGDYRISYRRGMIITSLILPTNRTDFLDRCLVVDMEGSKTLTKSAGSGLEIAFERDRPNILGGMLDLLVEAKKMEPTLNFQDLPRYSDFARYGAAMADILGYGARRYMDALLGALRESAKEAVEASDPVAAALIQLAQSAGKFTGGSDDLLAALNKLRPRSLPNGASWPESAVQLGKALSRVKDHLEEQGVYLEANKTRNGKRFTLAYVAPVDNAADEGTHGSGDAPCEEQAERIDPNTGEVFAVTTPPEFTEHPGLLEYVDGFPPAPILPPPSFTSDPGGGLPARAPGGFEEPPMDLDPPFVDDQGYPYTPKEPPVPTRALTPEDGAVMCYQCAYGGASGMTCMKTQEVIEDRYEFRLCDQYLSLADLKLAELEKEVTELKVRLAGQNLDPAAEDEEDERERAERERVAALLKF
ncbi:hypothetical protein NNJEOMEG_00627 [Fundidesulfovibrio magnetotacticus]|uniref:Uncharacterized protein n=1 Tax=Fundidesulfovibrio magnetotacticus TaxID=2730080 RepID=A0A6V8LP87_9BACT|nr:hypothetical protein [Fundidesulfovibrio magnetotacticus]GFK92800.1 hypothetical protein NNJEOMEG_00627 [Fundidesulfovibrio magnetotacticus]